MIRWFKKLFAKHRSTRDLDAYILLGKDKNKEEYFVECDVEQGKEADLSAILYLMNSGNFAELSFKSVLLNTSKQQGEEITEHAYEWLLNQSQEKQQSQDSPVVGPLNVFNQDKGDINDR